jgi:hypothetical protein
MNAVTSAAVNNSSASPSSATRAARNGRTNCVLRSIVNTLKPRS